MKINSFLLNYTRDYVPLCYFNNIIHSNHVHDYNHDIFDNVYKIIHNIRYEVIYDY